MATPSATADDKLPRQIPYIIGTEACERFSFYGMRNILTVFLIEYLLLHHNPDPAAREGAAKGIFHLFVSGVYFFPLLGGFLADRFFGKYRVIFWLSLFYVLGHAFLAVFENNREGFYAGLFLIALGSGGIKPCVSAMVGDQFTAENKHLVKKVFAMFYWTINFGSFFASLLMPKTLKLYGPSVAFGIPGVLMAISLLIFWLGRKHYVVIPPTGPNPHSFLRVIASAFKDRGSAGAGSADPGAAGAGAAGAGTHWLDAARKVHPERAVEGAKAVIRLLALFAPIPFFWMLFDQKASTWVVQAKKMDPMVWGFKFEPSQMQLVNPALVMLLIPFTAGVVYPLFKRLGYELTPLRRMTIGMAVGAFSYIIAGSLEVSIEGGATLSILWQIAPYIVLTIAEILISTTGLEFAYSQAPHELKGTVMSFWNLTVTAANLAVAVASYLNVFRGSAQFFFYSVMAFVAAVVLGLIARRYTVVDYYQPKAAPPRG
ncbi:POT family MFS transporter [Chondromyces apiculatus]|uniref:Di-/tripeptide transporter n=1 Tax=Chondromyces apiculatus DSM 436 TaxID=1192034 RepID=A0A017SW07_9BACT|nr:POT family MFS transporter [Chondromyces apiculatus]EYF01134.1 Di-/tripeptide transporter [Chondromyces apiculatus DSM 436]